MKKFLSLAVCVAALTAATAAYAADKPTVCIPSGPCPTGQMPVNITVGTPWNNVGTQVCVPNPKPC